MSTLVRREREREIHFIKPVKAYRGNAPLKTSQEESGGIQRKHKKLMYLLFIVFIENYWLEVDLDNDGVLEINFPCS